MSVKPMSSDNDDCCFIECSTLHVTQPFPLKWGGEVESLRLGFHVIGNPIKPTILVLGGISANRYFYTDSQNGWWQQVAHNFVKGMNEYCLIGVDYIGGNDESTRGDELFNIASCQGVDASDQAKAIKLLLKALSINKLEAIIGASYGGMVAEHFAVLFPDKLNQLIILNAAHRVPVISTAWRCIQRQILHFASKHDDSKTGIELARALAIATYRSAEEFEERFPRQASGHLAVESYLLHQGKKFSERFSPEAYLCLSESIDRHHIEPERITVPTAVLSTINDQIVPEHIVDEFVSQLPHCTKHQIISSPKGHDAFLTEPDKVSRFLRSCLNNEFQPSN